MTQSFLKHLPSADTPAKIITLTTGAAYEVFPSLSAYGISKLTVLQLMTYVAAESPNVFAVALHPGIVDTEMTIDSFKRFALDTPELVGGVGVWGLGGGVVGVLGGGMGGSGEGEGEGEGEHEIPQKNY